MADNNQPIEWYLARDGQQHGPVTDVELKKIIELGYLKPTDLVWRQGMSEWAMAESVLDLRSAPAPQAPRPQPAAPAAPGHGHAGAGQPAAHAQGAHAAADAVAAQRSRSAAAETQRIEQQARAPADVKPAPTRPSRGDAEYTRDGDPAPRSEKREGRSFPWRPAAALVGVAILAAGGLALYRSGAFSELPFLAAPATSNDVPVVNRPTEAARETTTAVTTSASTTDSASLPEPIEKRLQTSPLWQALHRHFPEWYAERVAEVAKLSSESKSQREIDAALTRSVVELRRRHQKDALAASPERLKAIASSFVDSLGRLSRISTSACYGYISQGEASPAVADLAAPDQRSVIDTQLVTIFDAIAEGRTSPAQRDQPRREDYDVLSKELGQRGWSAADLQLFTDARALSRAAPEKVCQMVQDWFAAQLAVPDEAVKIRLLGEALKPVVAG